MLSYTLLGRSFLPHMLGAGQAVVRILGSQYAFSSFSHAELIIEQTKTPKTPPPPEELGFGKVFTDHMFLANHTTEQGWSTPRIVPFQPISIHPAAQALHYGICCFEGMKAFMGVDGKGRLFRPEMNMHRLHRSSRRLMLADYDQQELLKCLKTLLAVDRRWLPHQEGYSIYIRPFIFAAAETLGIHPPSATTICILLSPVGPYFGKGGAKGVSLFLDEQHARAWPGGAGDTKIGSNYAPTIQPQVEAAEQHGCSQVVYTLPSGVDPLQATISECGAMNVFFLLRQKGGALELVTPPLDGTILPGVTRDSVLQLCRSRGEFQVSERPLTVGELVAADKEGRLVEAFGTGTASVVQPIAAFVRAGGQRLQVPKDAQGEGSVARRLSRELLDIQYGRQPSEWSVLLE